MAEQTETLNLTPEHRQVSLAEIFEGMHLKQGFAALLVDALYSGKLNTTLVATELLLQAAGDLRAKSFNAHSDVGRMLLGQQYAVLFDRMMFQLLVYCKADGALRGPSVHLLAEVTRLRELGRFESEAAVVMIRSMRENNLGPKEKESVGKAWEALNGRTMERAARAADAFGFEAYKGLGTARRGATDKPRGGAINELGSHVDSRKLASYVRP